MQPEAEFQDMNLDQTISLLTSLPVGDRLRLVQAVWESLPDDIDMRLSKQQQAEVERRVRDHDANPSSSISRDELVRQLRADN
jgi:putative addiction module component (TIGR02574 family)